MHTILQYTTNIILLHSTDSLRLFCFDMLGAGQETTLIMLEFLLLYMLQNPGAQARVHAELDRLLLLRMETETGDDGGNGSRRASLCQISREHEKQLPFLQAVINVS
jgi:cytochrome P450